MYGCCSDHRGGMGVVMWREGNSVWEFDGCIYGVGFGGVVS